MLDRRGLLAALLGLLAGCGKPPADVPARAVALGDDGRLTDAKVREFLRIVEQLPGKTPPAFQPAVEVDLTVDSQAVAMAARWQREFQSSYSAEVQAKLWKRDAALRGALDSCGIELTQFATLLIQLSTAVVRQSLDPQLDLAALGRQADSSIASLCRQYDGLGRDPRLSTSLRNSRAELLSVVLKETVAYREFLRLLEGVPAESVAVIAPHREVLQALMPATETVQLLRKKLERGQGVMQAGHETADRPGTRTR